LHGRFERARLLLIFVIGVALVGAMNSRSISQIAIALASFGPPVLQVSLTMGQSEVCGGLNAEVDDSGRGVRSDGLQALQEGRGATLGFDRGSDLFGVKWIVFVHGASR
jgi:hypothetical protein